MWFFLAGLVGCGPKEEVAQWMVTSTEISTVLRVEWSLDAEGTAWVEYGEGSCDRSTPPQDGTDGEVLLLGLGPMAEICVRLVAEIDGVEHAGDERMLGTGVLESAVPEFNVSGASTESLMHFGKISVS